MAESRYAGAPTYRVRTANGGRHPAVYAPEYGYLPLDFEYVPYRINQGDRLDLIAYRFLGSPELWWVLAHANPEIVSPDNIVPGTVLRIPSASV